MLQIVANEHSIAAKSIGAVHYYLPTAPAMRSGWREYLEQVREIAPPNGLLDRSAELAEIAAFCEGDGSYWCWQAGAWAGKSALMSWFVLNPPPGVVAVAFFVTARYASQDDSTAFVGAVVSQLEELLGEDLPGMPSQGLAGRYRLLLREAALRLEQTGKRLVLVVDALDEDRGPDHGLPSIASLLPAHCPGGLKVIVSSRSSPQVPSDVPISHPLRGQYVTRDLSQSPHAEAIRDTARLELRQLLNGSQLQQDLLGLITAAIGGLTLADLAELTGVAPHAIGSTLSGQAGRTLATRDAPGAPAPEGAEQVCLLAHDTLQVEATGALGGRRLDNYRNRIHAWADHYQARGWPAATPGYLMSGYFRMLLAAGDRPRLIAHATDPARQDQMLALTGSDAAALAEITMAASMLLGQPDPDLTAMTRLSVTRHRLTTRNRDMPVGLPAVWAALGHAERAEALARSVDARDQARALARLAKALTAIGLSERARQMAVDAHKTALSITSCSDLIHAAGALAAAGLHAEAGQATGQALEIARSTSKASRLADAAKNLASAGLREQAREIAILAGAKAQAEYKKYTGELAVAEACEAQATTGLGEDAERLAGWISDHARRVTALTGVACTLAADGMGEQAGQVAARAEAAANSLDLTTEQRACALAQIAEAFSAAGLPEQAIRLAGQAETIAQSLTSQAKALTHVVKALAAAGQRDRAEQAAGQAETAAVATRDLHLRIFALADLVQALTAAGLTERAGLAAQQAETAVRSSSSLGKSSSSLGQVQWSLRRIAQALASAGMHEEAEAIARAITSPADRAQAMTAVAEALAAAGRNEPAERAAREAEIATRSFADAGRRSDGYMSMIAEAFAGMGMHEQAGAIASSIETRRIRAGAMLHVAEALTAEGLNKPAKRAARQVEALASAIASPHAQSETAEAFTRAAKALAATGMDRRARRAAEHAEAAACSIREPYWRVEALTRLATTLAAADLDKHAVEAADKAETAARSITNQKKMVTALRLVANALAAVRLYDRAYGIAQSFPQPDDRVHALATLTEALASENLSERAREMACEAEAISRSLSNPYCAVPAAAARALTAAGLYERGRQEASRAEAAARSITHIDEEPGSALAQVVHHLAAAGMHDQAEAITRSITTPYWLTEATVEAAKSLIGAGQQLRAHRLISLALSLEEWRTPELIQVLPPEAAVLATTVFDLPTRPAP